MKKLLLISTVSFFFFANAFAQPQWKFHLAFEDATGAKDTIFFIWDTSASFSGNDSLLGEYPDNTTDSNFRVNVSFLYDGVPSYGHVLAVDFSDPLQNNVLAINYEYPIKISWDSSLFHSPSLPAPVICAEMSNDYFFYFGGVCHCLNMLETDTITAPEFGWWSQEHFPLSINMHRGQYACCYDAIEENNIGLDFFKVYPNPAENKLVLNYELNEIETVEIFLNDITGRKIKTLFSGKLPSTKGSLEFDISDLTPGVYLLHISGEHGQTLPLVKY